MLGFCVKYWPQSYKTFYAQLTMLINFGIVVGILTFVSMINVTSESLKARLVYFSIVVAMGSVVNHAQLS